MSQFGCLFGVAKISRRSVYRYEGFLDGCFDACEDTGFLTAMTDFMWEAVASLGECLIMHSIANTPTRNYTNVLT